VSNLVLSFYPNLVVIGGGLGCQPEFFGRVRELVLNHPEHHPDDLEIVPSALGDDAGLAGAAGWVAAPGVSA
jgi:predicted NBD/HSP70 family sugar kinase